MNHTQFFQALKKGEIASCYVFEGPEEYIKQTALKALEKAILSPGLEALNQSVLENPEADVLIAAAETMPFMTEKRLIVIRDCGMLSGKMREEQANTQRLCDYLPTIAPSACLVFFVRGKADGRKKLYTLLKKMGAIVSFDQLNDRELNRWIVQTMKGQEKGITESLADRLAFTVGKDTALLKMEMEKLAAHAGQRLDITQEDIDTVATKSVECTVFEMVDALVAGKTAESFKLLQNMLRSGGERVGILAMILRQYRILFHMKAMQEKRMPSPQIRSALGIPPFAMERTARQAAGYTLDQLEQAVRLCIDTDYKIKSGKLNQDGAVEKVMLTLCASKNA